MIQINSVGTAWSSVRLVSQRDTQVNSNQFGAVEVNRGRLRQDLK
jgi:hypothetical protein